MLKNHKKKSGLVLASLLAGLTAAVPVGAADEARQAEVSEKACQDYVANEQQYQEERKELLNKKNAASGEKVPADVAEGLFGEEEKERLMELNRLHNGCE
jgi:hypothetical protein